MDAENPDETAGGLARWQPDSDSERALRADIDRLYTDRLLAQGDPGASLAREMDAVGALSLPGLGQIDEILGLDRVDAGASREQVEGLLSLDKFEDLTIEGIRLNDFLDMGIHAESEKRLIKRGLQLLKRRMYSEAVEWWELNRATIEPTQHRQRTLLLLLLALTHRLSGNEIAAKEILADISSSQAGSDNAKQDRVDPSDPSN